VTQPQANSFPATFFAYSSVIERWDENGEVPLGIRPSTRVKNRKIHFLRDDKNNSTPASKASARTMVGSVAEAAVAATEARRAPCVCAPRGQYEAKGKPAREGFDRLYHRLAGPEINASSLGWRPATNSGRVLVKRFLPQSAGPRRRWPPRPLPCWPSCLPCCWPSKLFSAFSSSSGRPREKSPEKAKRRKK